MAIRRRGIDPRRKKVEVVGPKADYQSDGVMQGTSAALVRDRKGNLSAIRGKNFAGQKNESMAVDRKVAAGSSNGTYPGNVAPRVGGVMKKGPGKVVSYGRSSALKRKNIGRLRKMR